LVRGRILESSDSPHAFVIFKNGELFIRNMNISKYKDATYQNHEELRERKLLLTKKEIDNSSLFILSP
jgi:tmRNA-binding protein